jgi:hypothetical protein
MITVRTARHQSSRAFSLILFHVVAFGIVFTQHAGTHVTISCSISAFEFNGGFALWDRWFIP